MDDEAPTHADVPAHKPRANERLGRISMPGHRWIRVTTGAALFCAWLGLWAGSAMAQSGTTLQITNSTSGSVPVQITLGSSFGINNISQLPSSWNVTASPAGSATQGLFTLAGNSSVSFSSGTNSFSGNIAFGPTFNGRGCGNSAANACYPNATTLAEFTLNMPGETVDISGVNGTNAIIAINLSGQTSGNQWNDGSFKGANTNITKIANQPITSWSPVPGVYGWQGTNCTTVVLPVPNGPPSNLCAAPVSAPSAPQLQPNPQCNIQRSGPTGGTVQIVFTGWAPNSTPPANCVSP
ncbi:MAG TPA: hypothetical protein VK777_24220 [Reyranella sp.]|jgi:hypothetical protein|nr:hypothetical protein [Reyranella sp.]